MLLFVSGDSVPAHLEWEPEQPPLLVLPGAGGRFESQRELQDPGLPESHSEQQTGPQHPEQLQQRGNVPVWGTNFIRFSEIRTMINIHEICKQLLLAFILSYMWKMNKMSTCSWK